MFIHGCFWHRHASCKYTYQPKTRIGFWKKKFSENVARDSKNIKDLIALGWNVIVIWECLTRNYPTHESLKDIPQAIINPVSLREFPEV